MINIGNFNIYPNDIDYVKLEQQGLCKDGNLNDTYFKLYNTYLSLFYDILNDNGLNCFDNDLENSNLHFNQVEKEDMDMYQSNSIFKYFYVRNNLYLEKLSNEDIENLLSNDSNKKDIVLRTFKDIINIDDGYKVCYGPDTDNFWYDSDIFDGELADMLVERKFILDDSSKVIGQLLGINPDDIVECCDCGKVYTKEMVSVLTEDDEDYEEDWTQYRCFYCQDVKNLKDLTNLLIVKGFLSSEDL